MCTEVIGDVLQEVWRVNTFFNNNINNILTFISPLDKKGGSLNNIKSSEAVLIYG